MEYKLNPIRNRLPKQKLLIIGLVVLLVVLLLENFLSYISIQPVPPHQVELLESFELVWHSHAKSPNVLTESGALRDLQIFTYLDAGENKLILPTWEGNPLFPKLYLTSFELNTGKIQWQTLLDYNELALGNNSKNIIAVAQETERCTPDERGYCDAVRISSYSIATGEEEWVSYHDNMNSAATISVNDELVSISGFATRSDFREEISIAADTGEKLVFQDIRPDTSNYSLKINLGLLGFDEVDIVSNYEIDGGYLFFLTSQDNSLWVVDQNSPKIVGQVKFGGASFNEGNNVNEFAIASDDNIVTVYLGDSQQLLVFRFLPDE